MKRIVPTVKAVTTSSAVQTLAKLPARLVRRVLAAPTAFIDAIERFAAKY